MDSPVAPQPLILNYYEVQTDRQFANCYHSSKDLNKQIIRIDKYSTWRLQDDEVGCLMWPKLWQNFNLFSLLINNLLIFFFLEWISRLDDGNFHASFIHESKIFDRSMMIWMNKLTLTTSSVGSSSGVNASDDFRWPRRPVGALAKRKKESS